MENHYVASPVLEQWLSTYHTHY